MDKSRIEKTLEKVFMVIERTTSDLLKTLILLNRVMRNCRIQSTNYIQKVNDMECK